MTEILNLIPANAWTILAVALAGLILMIGLRVLRSKNTSIDLGPVDINIDEDSVKVSKDAAAATPAAPQPQPPSKPAADQP